MRTKYPNQIQKNSVYDYAQPSTPVNDNYSPTDTLGVAGTKISSGFVHDEFIRQLQGENGRKVYRQMKDNDATIGGVLYVIEMLIRAIDWKVEFDTDKLDDETAAALELDKLEDGTKPIVPGIVNNVESAVSFLEGVLFEDMDTTFDDFISIVLSMIPYGWQYTEMIFKRRLGPDQADETKRSIFNDGLIGIRKLADRSQETLDHWNIDEYGKLMGMWQCPPVGGEVRYIPIEKALHFTPTPNKDNPEGRSVLRNAYRSWYFLKNIQEIESIGIERELNGLPVVYIPNEILNGTDSDSVAAKNAYIKMVRDVKFNEQGGIVLPSDVYVDNEGKPSNVRMVDFKLVSTEGTRAIDTDKVIIRYQTDMTRSVLAEFIMLGTTAAGTRSLGESKIELFLRGLQGWVDSIAATINRKLVSTLWKLNGFDRRLMPYVSPGAISPENLQEIGDYVKSLSSAGIFLADEDTENKLRNIAGLPNRSLDDEGVDLNGNENMNTNTPGKDTDTE